MDLSSPTAFAHQILLLCHHLIFTTELALLILYEFLPAFVVLSLLQLFFTILPRFASFSVETSRQAPLTSDSLLDAGLKSMQGKRNHQHIDHLFQGSASSST